MTRAERRARTAAVIARRVRACVAMHPLAEGRWVLKVCKVLGPLGCGRSRCVLCHGDKLFGKPSFRDFRRWMHDEI